MSENTVYMVSSGAYSDYSVLMGFTTRELAEAFCERENATADLSDYDRYRVEEYELLDALPDAWVASHASATLMEDGTLADVRYWDSGRMVMQVSPEAYHGETRGGTGLRVNYHRSQQEAERALYDLAARIKAERAGIT